VPALSRVQDWEARLQPAHRPPFDAALAVNVLRDAEGNPSALRWLLHDVSARKQAEETAAVSARRLRLLVDTAPEAFVATDAAGTITDWNRQAEAVFGWSREEAVGRPLVETIIPPEHREAHRRGTERFLATGSSPVLNTRLEVAALHRNGRRFPVEMLVSAVSWGGSCVCSSFVRDLTERKRAERLQVARQAVTRALAESATRGEGSARVLEALCEITGGKVGVLWLPDRPAGVLRCFDLWHRAGLDVAHFAAVTRGLAVEPGAGLPGRVWQGGQPAWCADVGREETCRREAAARDGVRGALAFPLTFGQEVCGVIELLSLRERPRDDELLRALAPLGGQIGRFLERKRGEEVREERARQAAFTSAVGLAVTQAGSWQELLQRCAEAVVEHLQAALARIWALDEEEGVLGLQVAAGLDTHRDGSDGRVPSGHRVVGRIAQERRPHLTNDLAGDPQLSEAGWARREGLTAFAGYPLVVGDRVVGVLEVFGRRPLSEFTLPALAAAADGIASGLKRKWAEETLLANQTEFRGARRIQQQLFPRRPPHLDGLDVGGASFPAEATGGDYFDYVPMADGRLGVAVGDVSGHGLGPALLMASTRAYLRALARTHADVGHVLALLNGLLADDTPGDHFVTLVLAAVEPRTRSFVYASAGHLTGYVLDAGGSVKALLPSTGMPLGILPAADFPASPILTLEPGELMLLLTDGIVEARGPDDTEFGARRALDIVRIYRDLPAGAIVQALYQAVRAFCLNAPPADDVTAVVVKAVALR
jgi:PAS domain S-box-containing protein